MDLENAYNRINREALQQILKMYDVDGKLLSVITSIYVNTLACVRMIWVVCVRQVCIMSSWLFKIYMDAVVKKVKVGIGRMVVRFCVVSQRKI